MAEEPKKTLSDGIFSSGEGSYTNNGEIVSGARVAAPGCQEGTDRGYKKREAF